MFNADETGLNYKMLQKKTLASKLDSVAKGHKVKKERVTLLPVSYTHLDVYKRQIETFAKTAKIE